MSEILYYRFIFSYAVEFTGSKQWDYSDVLCCCVLTHLLELLQYATCIITGWDSVEILNSG